MITAEAMLTAWGIPNYPDGDFRKFACTHDGCGGSARLVDGPDEEGRWRLYCACTPETGRPFTHDQLAHWFGVNPTEGQTPDAVALESFAYPDFLAANFGEDHPVVEGLLDASTIAIHYGPSGSGKSWYGAELCRCVVAGRAFLGRFPAVRGAAVLVEQESPRRKLQGRLQLLETGESILDDCDELRIYPLQEGLTLDRPEVLAALAEAVEHLGAVVLVIDTLVAVAGGLDLLNPTQVRAFCNGLRPLAERTGVAIVLLAHTPKHAGKEPDLRHLYGSQDWGAGADACFEHVKLPGDPPAFRVACTKGRWERDADWPDFTFSIGGGPTGGCVLTAGETQASVAHIILAVLTPDEWTASPAIVKEVETKGIQKQSAYEALNRLVASGRVLPHPDNTDRRRSFRRAK